MDQQLASSAGAAPAPAQAPRSAYPHLMALLAGSPPSIGPTRGPPTTSTPPSPSPSSSAAMALRSATCTVAPAGGLASAAEQRTSTQSAKPKAASRAAGKEALASEDSSKQFDVQKMQATLQQFEQLALTEEMMDDMLEDEFIAPAMMPTTTTTPSVTPAVTPPMPTRKPAETPTAAPAARPTGVAPSLTPAAPPTKTPTPRQRTNSSRVKSRPVPVKLGNDPSSYFIPPPLPSVPDIPPALHELAHVNALTEWRPRSIRYRPWFEELIEAGNYVTVGASGPASATTSTPTTAPRFMYSPKRKLGSGGSADVFLGLQCDNGMEIALKRISLRSDHRGTVNRCFETEVNLLKTRYGMPGIVNYFGHLVVSGEDKDGEPTVDHYLALELMECDIKQLVHSWQSPQGKAGHLLACRYLMGSVLEILRNLWRDDGAKLIHRDIKEQNIMVGKMAMIKLGDFGISRQLSSATTHTMLGGTELYAPPEQLEGAKPHITGDVYSLGLVLHYALVGFEARPLLVLKDLEASLRKALPWGCARAAASHLLRHLLVSDPNAQFLVGLGSNRLSRPLLVRVERVIREEIVAKFGEDRVWWDVLDPELWQAKRNQLAERTAGRGAYSSYPQQLLRFIRNCHVHANDRNTDGERHSENLTFTQRPYFIDLLPGLVVKLWDVCRREEELQASTEVSKLLGRIYRPSLPAHQDERPHWF